MSITIHINASLEKRLREKANRAGVELNQLVERVLETWSEAPLPDSNMPEKSKERELLQKINNTGFSTDFWAEYKTLIQKRQAEIIGKEELASLIKMTNRLEKANVQRLKYLIELAQSRQVPVQALMEELGITQEQHD
jgi:hypothetical protein